MPLLPSWLRLAWTAVLCGVLVLHLVHAWAMPGQRRWWHAGHTVMAAGMVVMYLLPHLTRQVPGAALFAVLTASSAGAAIVFRYREGVLNPLWVASAVDMLAMTYMLLPAAVRPAWLTGVFVTYLTVQVGMWALGLWDRTPAFHRSGGAEPAVLDVPPSNAAPTAVVGLRAHSTPTVRLSLAAMTASMAYMLVAM